MLRQRFVQWAIEAFDNTRKPFDGARERGFGVNVFFWPDRCNDRDRVLHRVKNHNDRRTNEQGFRDADRVGVWRPQFLHTSYDVVAKIAEYPSRHWRQATRQLDPALQNQRAQGLQWRIVADDERLGFDTGRAVDFGFCPIRAPDHIRFDSDN